MVYAPKKMTHPCTNTQDTEIRIVGSYVCYFKRLLYWIISQVSAKQTNRKLRKHFI